MALNSFIVNFYQTLSEELTVTKYFFLDNVFFSLWTLNPYDWTFYLGKIRWKENFLKRTFYNWKYNTVDKWKDFILRIWKTIFFFWRWVLVPSKVWFCMCWFHVCVLWHNWKFSYVSSILGDNLVKFETIEIPWCRMLWKNHAIVSFKQFYIFSSFFCLFVFVVVVSSFFQIQ